MKRFNEYIGTTVSSHFHWRFRADSVRAVIEGASGLSVLLSEKNKQTTRHAVKRPTD